MNKGLSSHNTIVIIVMIVLLSGSIIYLWYQQDPSDPTPGIRYGDVYGEFNASGRISSREVYEDETISLMVLDAEDNVTSSFSLRVWNISKIQVGDISHGEYVYRNYTLNDEVVIIEDPGGWFDARILHGTFDIEYESVSIRYDGWYRYHYHFSSINATAVLDHQEGPYLDFQMLDVNVCIGNETFFLKEGKFGFPQGEHANIELVARGHGRISPIPTFHVDGSVSITDFREKTSKGGDIKDHDRFEVTANNITIITRKKGVTDIIGHTRYVIIQPWSIEVLVQDG